MSLSPEITARVQAVEAKLAELDPILHGFCTRRGYRFSSHVGVWPRRMVWAREEIDRTIALTMDLTVPEVMERGFYPEMPWSLRGGATLPPAADQPIRILNLDVFQGLPFLQLAGVLEARLEDARAMLQKVTREDIVERGQIYDSPQSAA
jgi:hypothetical protein